MSDMESKKIGIRADGNEQIGMGHLMRCISIAIALQEKHIQCVFITNNRQSEDFLTEKGFFCHRLQHEYACMDDELQETLELLDLYNIGLLLADSYFAEADYLKQLNKACPVFYMDDLGRMELPVSGIINYNIYGQDMGYKACYPSDTPLLLGSLYAPVKPEFSKTVYTVKKQVRNILITMGGSDVHNIAGQLSQRLLQELPKEVDLTVICGRFSPHLQQMQQFSNDMQRVRVLTDVADMWKQMAACDIAVAAAGSTLYELCTMGVPTVCCYYVENQRRAAQSFGRQTSMVNAGDFSADAQKTIENMTCEVHRLSKEYDVRLNLSQELKQICDGRGAERIAREIIKALQRQCS